MTRHRKTFVQTARVTIGTSGVLREDASLGLVGLLQCVQCAIVSVLICLQLLPNSPCRIASLALRSYHLVELNQCRRLRPHHADRLTFKDFYSCTKNNRDFHHVSFRSPLEAHEEVNEPSFRPALSNSYD